MSSLLWSAIRPSAAAAPQSPYAQGGGAAAGDPLDAARDGSPTAVTTANTVVGLLATRLGAFPRVVFERDDRTRSPRRSQQHEFLWGQPNPHCHSVPWWTTLFAHLVGWNNVFVWRRTAPQNDARTVGLDLIHPRRVKIKVKPGGERVYHLDGDTENGYGRDKIIHVMGLSWDGVKGVPPVRAGLGAHQVAELQERWQRSFLRRGAAPSGLLSAPEDMDDDAVAEVKEQLSDEYTGPEAVGGLILLQGGLKYTPITIPPSEAQLLQSRQYSREEVLGLYAPGTPHHLMGWKSNTSNFGTGIEQQNIGLVQHVLGPRQDLVGGVLAEALLPPELGFGWDTGGWTKGDARTTAEVATKMRQNGALSREEWRAMVGLPAAPLPDDWWQPKYQTALAAGGRVVNTEPPEG